MPPRKLSPVLETFNVLHDTFLHFIIQSYLVTSMPLKTSLANAILKGVG